MNVNAVGKWTFSSEKIVRRGRYWISLSQLVTSTTGRVFLRILTIIWHKPNLKAGKDGLIKYSQRKTFLVYVLIWFFSKDMFIEDSNLNLRVSPADTQTLSFIYRRPCALLPKFSVNDAWDEWKSYKDHNLKTPASLTNHFKMALFYQTQFSSNLKQTANPIEHLKYPSTKFKLCRWMFTNFVPLQECR